MYMDTSFVKAMADRFDLRGKVTSVRDFGDGHINDTFLVETRDADGVHDYILQRVNKNVFTDGQGLMQNMNAVTNYIRIALILSGGDPVREVLTLVPTREGKSYLFDEEGYVWRTTLRISDVFSYSVVVDGDQLFETGRAFGHFMRQLDRFDASELKETIPNFHNTPKRFEAFEKAVEEDKMCRRASVMPEIAFAMQYKEFAKTLVDQLEKGELPLRVTHNDTKINNVLMDKASGRAICVIDLDTVMPGLVAYDFGDSIRSGANPAAEDERDLSKVTMDFELYKSFANGYLEEAGSILTPAERRSLAIGAKMMTLECGVRFLTDYLEGDHYFKIHREGQNLDRARTQFKMVADMEKVWDEMLKVVE